MGCRQEIYHLLAYNTQGHCPPHHVPLEPSHWWDPNHPSSQPMWHLVPIEQQPHTSPDWGRQCASSLFAYRPGWQKPYHDGHQQLCGSPGHVSHGYWKGQKWENLKLLALCWTLYMVTVRTFLLLMVWWTMCVSVASPLRSSSSIFLEAKFKAWLRQAKT